MANLRCYRVTAVTRDNFVEKVSWNEDHAFTILDGFRFLYPDAHIFLMRETFPDETRDDSHYYYDHFNGEIYTYGVYNLNY